MATLKIKGYGTVTLELYPDLAPNTVNNFITLANSGFYDGLIFHRVIEDFMIQGGDPNGNGTGGPGYSIAGEFSSNGFTTNTLSHTKGVISMARAMNPDSAGSQFFIMSSDGTYLDGQYAAFGKVISGLDIIEKIQLVDTNNQDKPLKDIVIESIRVSLGALKVTTPIKIEDK
ncbi:peptidylprolyl isomerase [Cellulosilyticum lentocellum]|uniref:peptidylprolyl isomerase n=1 Tax=Cellulosilyticum lentocellum TaxID=29360 RepID=UPI002FE61DB9